MRLTLKTSLLGIIAVLLLLMAGQGWIAVTNLAAINENVTNEATNWVPSIDVVNKINTNTSDLRLAEAAHIMSTNESEMTRAENDFKAVKQAIDSNRAKYEKLISSQEEQKDYAKFSSTFDAYLKRHDELLSLSQRFPCLVK